MHPEMVTYSDARIEFAGCALVTLNQVLLRAGGAISAMLAGRQNCTRLSSNASTRYKVTKMLSVNGWPSTATQVKTTLLQAPKSKESLGLSRPRVASRFAQSKLSIRVVERNDAIDVSR